MLLSLALAQAGDLTVTVTLDEETSSFVFEELASCDEAEAVVEGDGRWAVDVRAAGLEDGDVYIDLDVEVATGKRRKARQVELQPRLRVREGEAGRVVVGYPEGQVAIEVLASGFEVDESCSPGERRRVRRERRSRSDGDRHRSHDGERHRG